MMFKMALKLDTSKLSASLETLPAGSPGKLAALADKMPKILLRCPKTTYTEEPYITLGEYTPDLAAQSTDLARMADNYKRAKRQAAKGKRITKYLTLVPKR
jgi:hypothetical protein